MQGLPNMTLKVLLKLCFWHENAIKILPYIHVCDIIVGIITGCATFLYSYLYVCVPFFIFLHSRKSGPQIIVCN